MPTMRRLLILVLFSTLILAGLPGCGSPPSSDEPLWREEVGGSLHSLQESKSFHYRLHLETWIGVSGQSIYGDQKGEGSYVDGDFSIQLLRSSPAGEEILAAASWQGQPYLQENNLWRPIAIEEAPSPLCDPRRFLELASGYGAVSLEGEEERNGTTYHRYLLQLSADRARDALSQRAWSYFSQLRYELYCRVWISDSSAPPSSMQLEVVGYDPEESLQRYRLLAVMDPYDIDSPEVELIMPRL